MKAPFTKWWLANLRNIYIQSFTTTYLKTADKLVKSLIGCFYITLSLLQPASTQSISFECVSQGSGASNVLTWNWDLCNSGNLQIFGSRNNSPYSLIDVIEFPTNSYIHSTANASINNWTYYLISSTECGAFLSDTLDQFPPEPPIILEIHKFPAPGSIILKPSPSSESVFTILYSAESGFDPIDTIDASILEYTLEGLPENPLLLSVSSMDACGNIGKFSVPATPSVFIEGIANACDSIIEIEFSNLNGFDFLSNKTYALVYSFNETLRDSIPLTLINGILSLSGALAQNANSIHLSVVSENVHFRSNSIPIQIANERNFDLAERTIGFNEENAIQIYSSVIAGFQFFTSISQTPLDGLNTLPRISIGNQPPNTFKSIYIASDDGCSGKSISSPFSLPLLFQTNASNRAIQFSSVENRIGFGQRSEFKWQYFDTTQTIWVTIKAISNKDTILRIPDSIDASLYRVEYQWIYKNDTVSGFSNIIYSPKARLKKAVANAFNTSGNDSKWKIDLGFDFEYSFQLDIWNRYGQKVIHKLGKGNTVEWDGRDEDGKLVDTGVYIYAIRISDNGYGEIKSGNITVLK